MYQVLTFLSRYDIYQLLFNRIEVDPRQEGCIMHKDAESWEMTLAECGLLAYSIVEEAPDGHISVTITASVSMEPNASNEQSEEAALEILSGCEISSVWWADDGYGLALNSLYDDCTITVYDGTEWYDLDEERDTESVQLDQEFGEIFWEGYPEIYLYNFLDEAVGGELANVFLKHASPGVCLRRVYDTEKCKMYLPQRVENSFHELWNNATPAWSIRSRN